MRLGNLTGFELGGIAIDPGKPPDTSFEKCRLVVFVGDQVHPVYISEEFRLTSNHSTSLNEVSFANKSFYRSFRLAIQLWHLIDDGWKVADEWIVDLRQAKAQPLKKIGAKPRLAILTDAGTVLCYASPEEEEHKQRSLKLAAENNNNNNNNNNSGKPDTKNSEDSLISRWLSWGKTSSNGSANGLAKSKSSRQVSLSYPMLVDLWSLQHSLDEARSASIELASRINELIPSSPLEWNEKQSVLERRLRIIRKNIKLVHTEIEICRNKATKVRYGANSLTTKLQESSEGVSSEATQITKSREASAPPKDLTGQIRYQQGVLASQLQEIFPIELVGDGRFHFAINGLMLPSVFAINQYDTTQIGAALGFVAQVVLCLSFYLDIPLPYPVTVYGSQSYITDNITQIKHGSNKFPLWTRGALLYRVEYALYLLHKDIEQILNAMELPVADLKQTLANLKNILLVLSSQQDTVNNGGNNIEVPPP